jgi:hypothetical protein
MKMMQPLGVSGTTILFLIPFMPSGINEKTRPSSEKVGCRSLRS